MHKSFTVDNCRAKLRSKLPRRLVKTKEFECMEQAFSVDIYTKKRGRSVLKTSFSTRAKKYSLIEHFPGFLQLGFLIVFGNL